MVAFPPMASQGDVGRVGFQDEGFLRELCGIFSDSLRPVVGDRAADTDTETKLYIGTGLLITAAEGMDDPTLGEMFSADGRQDLVVRLAHMQENRQLGGYGYCQLLFKQQLLRSTVNVFGIVIKTDFANRHRSLWSVSTEKFFQLLQMMRVVVFKIEWMQAGGTEYSLLAVAQLHEPFPAGLHYSGQNYFFHSRSMCCGQCRPELLKMFLQIKVAVGVD